ncbi:hypothetical protein A2950_01910 [Candidatus Kaiserbacteria bacterium RIFCSPLOWO2_01_FULL_55_19]|uniref:Type IV pilus modification protein PilV n=1 Tax=Candidatus Kaiserbacteria bacterium RIFCSPLOWO2_01_FULL_55_19 TaxID=1798516 RepID=A0A1F6ESP9_9BACT|nr:MAG: hypothetical protein A2950_01910 [Candidatus Kaiserbacteria bacterium RIFCSPLOWO2_01_FULL_55_19]
MQSSRGFSLIEIVVSIFIISVLLLLLLAVTRSGVLVRASKGQGVALAIVRNELESLRAGGYAALPGSGTFGNALVDTLPQATTTLMVSDYNAKTKQVTATVIWLDAGATASSTVSLSTLITQTGGLP